MDDDAWWAAQPDVGPYYMDAEDAAGWTPGTGWFDPIDAELDQTMVLGDDQLDLCDHAVVDSPLMHRRPWVSPLPERHGCLTLFAGECAGDTLAWVHGGLTPGPAGGWWSGDEELIGIARKVLVRLPAPDDPNAVPFVIACICGTTDDATIMFADEYRERYGNRLGAVLVERC
ncbi:hypothetical protein [Mycolicibacterium brumae]|uniref:hypothetical protein n=1 Tax=Mycolicibacterium brumae TaxID=85968 RepID=UPI000FE2467B|nr:hypothetical protein [Mycolicibacterium brumae]MCV7194092.1 hypothetical protein [Mycolicibacterium brumae]UWW07458.1 hypothetical protein L2Z93_000473 [Mycolicibacterium brumae]